MNKEFIKKMIKSERLKYEAIKEILPECAKKRVDLFESNAADLIKELAIEIITEPKEETKQEINKKDEKKKETKKVNVDFSY